MFVFFFLQKIVSFWVFFFTFEMVVDFCFYDGVKHRDRWWITKIEEKYLEMMEHGLSHHIFKGLFQSQRPLEVPRMGLQSFSPLRCGIFNSLLHFAIVMLKTLFRHCACAHCPFPLFFALQPREKGRMRFHRLQNVQIALDFLKQRQVKQSKIPNDFCMSCVKSVIISNYPKVFITYIQLQGVRRIP